MDDWRTYATIYAAMWCIAFAAASARLIRNGAYKGLLQWFASGVVIASLVTAGVAWAYSDTVVDVRTAIGAYALAAAVAVTGNMALELLNPLVRYLASRINGAGEQDAEPEPQDD